MVTKSTGLRSVEEVLREDTNFPSSAKELAQHQGWKLIDITEDKGIRAAQLLKRLPERTYNSVEEVVQTLSSIKSW